MKFLTAVLISMQAATVFNSIGVMEQNEQIEQLQYQIEQLNEDIFILQGDDHNETY